MISTRIEYAADQPPSLMARWTSRLALFCVMLLASAFFLHRVLALPTPIAMNLAAASFVGAVIAILMALVAGLDIWVTGRQGSARVVGAMAMSLALLALPLMAWMASRDYPMIADVTTDTANPPQFAVTASMRGEGYNPVTYNAAIEAPLQAAGYPDLRTLEVPRSAGDTFDVVLQALTKLKLKPLAETAPADAPDGAGAIELTERTLVFGFRDDVVIRVSGDDASARVDVRSASRYGRNDFGRNAARVRTILREIVGRLEATVPSQSRSKDAQDARAKLKRPEGERRPTTSRRIRPRPARPASRHAPERSAAPPE
ncbi:MAG TPA: DUF1499 domain-containing protein [Hyphomicrobium sp.]|nr:DUF1499 domain-containing protein [Hyphomicrobium sp.]